MSFSELAKKRFSVRKFKENALSNTDIGKILAAGNFAPTACNLQPQRIKVIKGDDLEKLKASTKCHFGTPTAFLIMYDKNECWTRKYDGAKSGEIDASIVATHMMLAAEELGIGCTWVMHFNPAALTENFNIPENLVPVALLVMGYPADDAEPIEMHFKRKDINDILI